MISEHCRDFRHDRCHTCPCACHHDKRLIAEVDEHAGRYAITAQAARDLLASLRSGGFDVALTVEQSARVVRYVIDHGWRPVRLTDDPAIADEGVPGQQALL